MGYPRGGYKTTRCVRADNNGTYYLPELQSNGDGTVTDQVTQLMWMNTVDDQKREWEESLQHCEDLVFAGFDDWKKPALDEGLFPELDYTAYYWSRTPETRDAARNLMSETTIQPEDAEINSDHENVWASSFMLGANWRLPRKLQGYALCARYQD